MHVESQNFLAVPDQFQGVAELEKVEPSLELRLYSQLVSMIPEELPENLMCPNHHQNQIVLFELDQEHCTMFRHAFLRGAAI